MKANALILEGKKLLFADIQKILPERFHKKTIEIRLIYDILLKPLVKLKQAGMLIELKYSCNFMPVIILLP